MFFSSGIHLIYRRKKPYARKRPSHMLEPTTLDSKQCGLTVSQIHMVGFYYIFIKPFRQINICLELKCAAG